MERVNETARATQRVCAAAFSVATAETPMMAPHDTKTKSWISESSPAYLGSKFYVMCQFLVSLAVSGKNYKDF
jgi:hypothetical protein